jgi:hypothetical protein
MTQKKCPQLVIACPLETVEQNTQLRFSALVAGDDPNAALTYSWSLSSGKISEGQGTPSIIVDTTGMGGRRITAKVLVGGLGQGCQSTVSCAILVMKSSDIAVEPAQRATKPAEPLNRTSEAVAKPTEVVRKPAEVIRKPAAEVVRKPAAVPRIENNVSRVDKDVPGVNNQAVRRLDDYGDLTFELEKEHLAGSVRELRRAPEALVYIVVYGGRCDTNTAALERAERAKDWLINKHGIDASRIVTIDGGYRESQATEIFIGPVDATWPELKASAQPLDRARCK